jgi:DNA-binding HxlR family transcriptional regulator
MSEVLDPKATDWSTEGCTIEAALNIMGDRQTFLILREILTGKRRFSEILELTGLSRQVLSDRLAKLLDGGLVRQHTYQAPGSRPRAEYRLTDKGFDLYPVVLALLEWGNRYECGPDGPLVKYEHRDCGAEIHLVARCDAGHDVTDPRDAMPRPGPGARPRVTTALTTN